MGMSGVGGTASQGLSNVGNVLKGTGTTVQPTNPTTPSAPKTTTPSTGQWYDNPNWNPYSPQTNPNPNQETNAVNPYSQNLYNAFRGQNIYRNAPMYQQSNQTYEAPTNPTQPGPPSYMPQNGYMPYYVPTSQNAPSGNLSQGKSNLGAYIR